jgi:hypothetical protein
MKQTESFPNMIATPKHPTKPTLTPEAQRAASITRMWSEAEIKYRLTDPIYEPHLTQDPHPLSESLKK